MKNLFKNLISGVVGTTIILGIFWGLANIINFLEQHFWLIIPIAIIDFYLILKETLK